MPDEFCHRSSAQVPAGGGSWLLLKLMEEAGGEAAWRAAVTFNT